MNEVVILTIDLGVAKDDIVIHPDSVAEELASAFCMKHSLDKTIEASLTKYLYQSFKFSECKKETPGKSVRHAMASPKASELSNRALISYTEPSEKLPKTPSFDKDPLPGERLYNKAISALKLKQENREKRVESLENPELLSSKRSQSSKLRTTFIRPEITIMEKYNRSKEKLEKQKQLITKEKLKECSFHPVTNHMTNRASNKSEPKNRNVLLYESYKRKQEKLLNKSQTL